MLISIYFNKGQAGKLGLESEVEITFPVVGHHDYPDYWTWLLNPQAADFFYWNVQQLKLIRVKDQDEYIFEITYTTSANPQSCQTRFIILQSLICQSSELFPLPPASPTPDPQSPHQEVEGGTAKEKAGNENDLDLGQPIQAFYQKDPFTGKKTLYWDNVSPPVDIPHPPPLEGTEKEKAGDGEKTP